jgi:2,4-dienoyl-CoA reductase-like NADH-dependent reductase (Old Yellow Enzyme family)
MAAWRPPERIKYTPLAAPWPNAAEVKNSQLFQPIKVGPVRVTSRTWVPAMVPWRASEDGEVTPSVLAWYERFARGRPGALVVEATGVRDVASGPLLRISDDRFLPGLAKLTECVRRASGGETKLFIQIIDFLSIRRRPSPQKYFERFLTVTPRHREFLRMPDSDEAGVRARLAELSEAELESALTARELESLRQGFRERVTDTDVPAVRDLPATLPGVFAAAAARARGAGFDGVELHYAHAYTMASFLSARNTRSDGYGGARSQRIRLPLEVYCAVRARVGGDYPVGCRMLAEDCIESGSTVEDAEYFAERLAGAGMDFISLIRTRAAAAMNACRPTIRMPSVPSAATTTRPRGSAPRFAGLDSTHPSCSPAEYIISIKRSMRFRAVRRILSDLRARRWPTRIGSPRFAPERVTRCAPASTPIIARRWINVTGR